MGFSFEDLGNYVIILCVKNNGKWRNETLLPGII